MKVKEVVERLSKLDPELECMVAYDELSDWYGPFEIRVNKSVIKNEDQRIWDLFGPETYTDLSRLNAKLKKAYNKFKTKIVVFAGV